MEHCSNPLLEKSPVDKIPDESEIYNNKEDNLNPESNQSNEPDNQKVVRVKVEVDTDSNGPMANLNEPDASTETLSSEQTACIAPRDENINKLHDVNEALPDPIKHSESVPDQVANNMTQQISEPEQNEATASDPQSHEAKAEVDDKNAPVRHIDVSNNNANAIGTCNLSQGAGIADTSQKVAEQGQQTMVSYIQAMNPQAQAACVMTDQNPANYSQIPTSQQPGTAPGFGYTQIPDGYNYENVPGMETLADTAVSMLQQSLEQAHQQLNQPMGKTITTTWRPLPDGTYEPVPDDGQRYGYQARKDVNGNNVYPMSYPIPDPMPWSLTEKQAYQGQDQWMQTMGNQPANQAFHVSAENTWPATNMGDIQGLVYPQQTAPLDMTPRGDAPGIVPPAAHTGLAGPLKRSASFDGDYGPPSKFSKAAADKYQISTNVHTLKPRHMVAWYIDHLMEENERVTQISKSYTIPVNIFNSKDMYFMEALYKKSHFPSPKFLRWMNNNFPNINIHAIDFSEGRRGQAYYTPVNEQLIGKHRNEVIRDTFFYFQHRKMN